MNYISEIPILHLLTPSSLGATPPPAELATMKLDMSSTCNIACDYCFVDEGHALPGPKLMRVETIERAVSWFSQQHQSGSAVIVLFGGEPLLNRKGVGLVCKMIGDLRKHGQDLRLQLITNATLASEDICEKLAYAEATVMVSIDGNQESHDTHRRDHGGRPTYDRVINGLNNIQKHIPADRIWARATMSENITHVSYFNQIVKLGINQVSLGYIDDKPPFNMSAEDYRCEIDDLMLHIVSLAKSGLIVRIHPLGTYLSLIYGEIGRGETWPRYDCGAATRIVSVTPDGEIYPCEHAVLARHKHNWSLGTVWKGINPASVSKFLSETSRTHQGCQSCGTASMCDQGCRVDSTLDDSRNSCHATENFLEILWERALFWYKKLAEDNPSILLSMVDGTAYRSIREESSSLSV